MNFTELKELAFNKKLLLLQFFWGKNFVRISIIKLYFLIVVLDKLNFRIYLFLFLGGIKLF